MVTRLKHTYMIIPKVWLKETLVSIGGPSVGVKHVICPSGSGTVKKDSL